MSLVNRIIKRLKISVSDKLTQTLYLKGISSDEIFKNSSTNSIKFALLDFEIPILYNCNFVIDGYGYAKKIKEVVDAKFKWSGSELHVSINGINHQVQTEEDLFILYEIYFEGVYNYVFNKPHVIADIGMNVGFSSLYFAQRDNVVSIHGFEPFKPTFNQALKNLSLNTNSKSKIFPNNFGLGEKDEVLKLKYNYDWKGSVGVGGIPDRISNNIKIVEEEIIIRTIDFLNTETFKNNDLPIGLKIDCEGAEYGIVSRLVQLPIINKVEWIMMEWHDKGPTSLIESLSDVGFSALSLLPNNKGTGMIYAFRQS